MSENTGLIVGGGISVLICFCCIISSIVIAILYYNGAFTDEEEDKKEKEDDLPLVTPPSGIPSGGSSLNKEVFNVHGAGEGRINHYIYSKADSVNVCSRYDASMATLEQLKEAQTAGADWCISGWLKSSTSNDVSGAAYPTTTTLSTGCGTVGVNFWTHPNNSTGADARAGVTCYGVKPADNTENRKIIASFNSKKWSRFSTTPLKEVFHIPGYIYTQETAKAKCQSYGAELATDAQLQSAHASGADWCETGWLSDIIIRKYPIQKQRGGCNDVNGVATFNFIDDSGNALGGANCYGEKPSIDNSGSILFFSGVGDQWSMYSTGPFAIKAIPEGSTEECAFGKFPKKCPVGKCCNDEYKCVDGTSCSTTSKNALFHG